MTNARFFRLVGLPGAAYAETWPATSQWRIALATVDLRLK